MHVSIGEHDPFSAAALERLLHRVRFAKPAGGQNINSHVLQPTIFLGCSSQNFWCAIFGAVVDCDYFIARIIQSEKCRQRGREFLLLVTRGEEPRLQKTAFELFGKGAALAQSWGLYLEAVPEAFPPVPGSYRTLSTDLPGDWKVIRPKMLDPHDLAATKLRRFHSGDRQDLHILCDSGDLTIDGLKRALGSAYPWGMDEEEEPDCKRVNDHLRIVIDYLEGKRNSI